MMPMPHLPVRTEQDIADSVKPWRYVPLEVAGLAGTAGGFVLAFARSWWLGLALFVAGVFAKVLVEKLDDRRVDCLQRQRREHRIAPGRTIL